MNDTKAPHRSLRTRTVRAGGWSMGQVGAMHGLRLVSNLIMTRLLLPEAFGLMAMVVALITAFTLFSDIGINRSIVREPDGETEHFLRVAWVVKILRGSLIACGVGIMAVAVWILGADHAAPGTVYADPRLPALIGLAALHPFIQGVESTKKELAQRRLQLGPITFLSIGAQILSILAMVGFAQISPTVWALMAGMLTGAVVQAIGTHLILPGPTMKPAWDSEIVDRLWQYGKWLMGSSVFAFFALNADKFILGALLNATVFGVYAIARIWIDAGRQVVGRLTSQVGFSSIGEVIRDRPKEAPRVFRKFQIVIDGICLAAFLSLFLFGQTLIDALYTEAYVEAGTYMKIMSIWLLCARFDPVNGLLMNMGDSRAMMIISGMRAVTLCVALPVAFHIFGMTGALFAVALSPMASVPYALRRVSVILGKQTRIDWAWAIAIPALAVAIGVFSF